MQTEKQINNTNESSSSEEIIERSETILPAGEMRSVLDLNPNFYREEIEEVMVETLKRIAVQDPRSPFRGVLPVIIRTPADDFTRNGQERIDVAKANGVPSIRARILYTHNTSPAALELSKIESGNMPENGGSRFAESVRDISIEIDRLLNIPSLFILKKQGGVQPNDGRTDVMTYLAERFGKARSTIVNYKAYGEYIDLPTFDMLVEHDVKKDFFEGIMSGKTRLIKRYTEVGASLGEITEVVSGFVARSLGEKNVLARIGSLGNALLEHSKKNAMSSEIAADVARILETLQVIAGEITRISEPGNGETTITEAA